ncbi:hypothetical protein [Nostoc sp. ChiVER01]|uniref:hypothetical protein n=1 Tax=Nostoc sp. ChiVER01 TaxID=3075382 RepID=UPI002AD29F85|nr:hypothetical protein [Nostoc sp. ChiVER01]MDZ8223646.1 hypothetical protein [Nostoc sp. ChiVER01]
MLRKFPSLLAPRIFAGGLLLVFGFGQLASAQFSSSSDETTFELFPNKQFINCMAATPGVTPRVQATVKRGNLNDQLTLRLTGFKSGLKFDLFTVENSPQQAFGTPNPNFKNFGLAWYQSDVEPRLVTIKTILLDQIFGFDPEVNLLPTNTFHVGFWFNNPKDAAACGFDVRKPTPFNGEHKAGPLAFISRPNSLTNLGPLCINPNTSKNPPTCNP